MLDFEIDVGEIMVKDVHTVTSDSSVAKAVQVMLGKHIRAIPVVDEKGTLQGMVTDSDIAFRTTKKSGILGHPISEVMTKNPISVTPDTDIYHVVKIMEEHHIRRLPVVKRNNKVVGIVSVRDVVRQILRNLETLVEEEEEE